MRKSKDELEKEVEALGVWHQHFRLPNGVRTGTDPRLGYDVESRWALIEPYLPKSLEGKTVLDLAVMRGSFRFKRNLKVLPDACWLILMLSACDKPRLRPNSLKWSWS